MHLGRLVRSLKVELLKSGRNISCTILRLVKFVSNDNSRVTIECIKKKYTDCKWRFISSTMLKMNGFFMIKKIENIHTCGVACKDIKNCHFTNKLIKLEIRDKPFVMPKYIVKALERIMVGH